MPKTIGIELKAKRAIYVVLEGFPDDFSVEASGYFELANSKSQDDIKSFHNSWMSFLDNMDCQHIGIKERISKGRFAGGALSFKMEGLIQLSDYEIQIVHGTKIRNKLKGIDPSFGTIHGYQEEAARVAYYLMMVESN